MIITIFKYYFMTNVIKRVYLHLNVKLIVFLLYILKNASYDLNHNLKI